MKNLSLIHLIQQRLIMLNKKSIVIISLPLYKPLTIFSSHNIKPDKTLLVWNIQASGWIDAGCSLEVCKLLLDHSGMKSLASLSLLRHNSWAGQWEMWASSCPAPDDSALPPSFPVQPMAVCQWLAGLCLIWGFCMIPFNTIKITTHSYSLVTCWVPKCAFTWGMREYCHFDFKSCLLSNFQNTEILL